MSMTLAGASVISVANPASAAPVAVSSPDNLLTLTNGQAVTIDLANVDFSTAVVQVVQCPRGSDSFFDDCFGSTGVNIGVEDGVGSGPYTVSALPECLAAPECAIYAIENLETFDGGAAGFVNIAFTAEPPPVVPEVPRALLLPLGAAAVFGAGAVATRRRHHRPPAGA